MWLIGRPAGPGGTPSGFARVTAPMMERAMQRATTADLARLKEILESSGPMHPSAPTG